MNYTITIETIEMNIIKISSPDAAGVYYDLNKWTVGEAVEDYISNKLTA